MSSKHSADNQPADPYKEKNLDEGVTLKDKVEDLVKFVEKCKFCMMTTRAADSGFLASRCMALAGKVRLDNLVDVIFAQLISGEHLCACTLT
jgi:hypothetical protein